jgi:hypothetical protein
MNSFRYDSMSKSTSHASVRRFDEYDKGDAEIPSLFHVCKSPETHTGGPQQIQLEILRPTRYFK